jgi:hypothetical protein
MSSRLLKNALFSSLRCGTWRCRRFSNTQVFEKRSKTKITLFVWRAEKVQDGLFQQPASTPATGWRFDRPVVRAGRSGARPVAGVGCQAIGISRDLVPSAGAARQKYGVRDDCAFLTP